MPIKIKMPGPKARERAFAPYALELGKLTFSWNHLHEALAQLFWETTGIANGAIALAIWHSTPSDRSQRQMLRAAADQRFAHDARAHKAIMWLLKKTDHALSGGRNDAIHAPLILTVEGDEIRYEPFDHQNNPRAQSLRGKDLLIHLQLWQQQAEVLRHYAVAIRRAILRPEHSPWPDEPTWPTLGQQKARTKMPRARSGG